LASPSTARPAPLVRSKPLAAARRHQGSAGPSDADAESAAGAVNAVSRPPTVPDAVPVDSTRIRGTISFKGCGDRGSLFNSSSSLVGGVVCVVEIAVCRGGGSEEAV
jgi:hypothetical protein